MTTHQIDLQFYWPDKKTRSEKLEEKVKLNLDIIQIGIVVKNLHVSFGVSTRVIFASLATKTSGNTCNLPVKVVTLL